MDLEALRNRNEARSEGTIARKYYLSNQAVDKLVRCADYAGVSYSVLLEILIDEMPDVKGPPDPGELTETQTDIEPKEEPDFDLGDL